MVFKDHTLPVGGLPPEGWTPPEDWVYHPRKGGWQPAEWPMTDDESDSDSVLSEESDATVTVSYEPGGSEGGAAH